MEINNAVYMTSQDNLPKEFCTRIRKFELNFEKGLSEESFLFKIEESIPDYLQVELLRVNPALNLVVDKLDDNVIVKAYLQFSDSVRKDLGVVKKAIYEQIAPQLEKNKYSKNTFFIVPLHFLEELSSKELEKINPDQAEERRLHFREYRILKQFMPPQKPQRHLKERVLVETKHVMGLVKRRELFINCSECGSCKYDCCKSGSNSNICKYNCYENCSDSSTWQNCKNTCIGSLKDCFKGYKDNYWSILSLVVNILRLCLLYCFESERTRFKSKYRNKACDG